MATKKIKLINPVELLCSQQVKKPPLKREYRKGELIIGLTDSAVRLETGFTRPILDLLSFLKSKGAISIQSLHRLTRPNATAHLVVKTNPHQPNISLGPVAVPWPSANREVVEELRLLWVKFKPGELPDPAAALLRCVHLVPGVRYAERIPLARIPDVVVPPPLKTTPWDPEIVINWQGNSKGYDPAKVRIGVLDTGWNASSSSISVFVAPDGTTNNANHGMGVVDVLTKLAPDIKPRIWRVTEPSGTLDNVDPGAYFTALQAVASHWKGGMVDFNNPLQVDVINISYGNSLWTQTEWDHIKAIEDVGVVVVAAAGNFTSQFWVEVDFPAAYPTVLSVGAADADGTGWKVWWGSRYGFDTQLQCLTKKDYAVDVVAPGLYDGIWGTSYAAPRVAALAGILRSKGMTAAATRDQIRSKASHSTNPDIMFGYGLIDWTKSLV